MSTSVDPEDQEDKSDLEAIDVVDELKKENGEYEDKLFRMYVDAEYLEHGDISKTMNATDQQLVTEERDIEKRQREEIHIVREDRDRETRERDEIQIGREERVIEKLERQDIQIDIEEGDSEKREREEIQIGREKRDIEKREEKGQIVREDRNKEKRDREEVQNDEIGDTFHVLSYSINVTDESEVQNGEHEGCPSVFVDWRLLPSKNLDDNVNFKAYNVNGTVFRDNEGGRRDYELLQFEVKTRHRSECVRDKVLRNGDGGFLEAELQAQDIDSDLQFSAQTTPYGVVINSAVVLNTNAWNTIVGDDHLKCIACETSFDSENTVYHISTEKHADNLKAFEPLKEFELNIVRQIHDKYHCGICNIIFDDINEHLENEFHGGKMLASINRTSDIMNDLDIHRVRNKNNDCVHFPINATRNTGSEYNSWDTDDRGDDNSDYFIDDSGFDLNATRNRGNDDYNNERNISNGLLPENSSGFESESFDGFYDYVDECKTDNGNDKTISYADMAKKAKTFVTPPYVLVQLNKKSARVEYDCWNMIIALKNNTYYCMACQKGDLIRFKSDHSVEASHIENLMKCPLVEDYKEHVVRKVDDKWYHCGHCNNLQINMREHIQTTHMKNANRNLIENPLTTVRATSSPKSIDSNTVDHKRNASPKPVTDNRNIGNENTTEIKNINNHTKSSSVIIAHNENVGNEDGAVTEMNSERLTKSLTENTIFIIEFGQCFRVSVLSYHFIQQRTTDFYCFLCRVPSTDVLFHITKDVNHASLLARTAFWLPTGIHLIRAIGYGFYCLLCNKMVQYPSTHIYAPMHTFLLNKALVSIPTHAIAPFPGAPIFYQNKPPTEKICVQIENKNQNNQHKPQYVPNSNVTSAQIGNMDNDKPQCVPKANVASAQIGNMDNDKHVNKMVLKENIKEENEVFDPEHFVYIKIKNLYAKITLTSYNGLVEIGTGVRYCFLCSSEVFDLSIHVRSETHVANIKRNKFLEKYEKHLLRQITSKYHCALCNVIITRNFLSEHLSWAPHNETDSHKIVKNTRRNEVKSGVKEIICQTQKEIISKDKDSEWKIILNVTKPTPQRDIVKKKKTVRIDGVTLKITWDAFHGVSKKKNEYKCIICQISFKNYELASYMESPEHRIVLNDTFMMEYAPNLIRRVNETMLHCLTCNTDVANETQWIQDHVTSKRHVKQFKMTVDNDADDSNDILTLNSGKKK